MANYFSRCFYLTLLGVYTRNKAVANNQHMTKTIVTVGETFRHHSAKVHVCRRGVVAIASYTGPLCNQAFDVLRPRVVTAVSGAQCLVIRMDRSLCLMGESPGAPNGTYRRCAAPGAVIVRPEQLDLWQDYAKAMATIGVRRGIFLNSEMEMCREWIDWQLAV